MQPFSPEVQRLLEHWNLQPIATLSGATCSDVLLVRDHAAGELVLKVPHAHAEERYALDTLRAFASHGGVQVLNADEATGAVLMPRILPGTTLADERIEDLEAVAICCRLTRQLREATASSKYRLAEFFTWNSPESRSHPLYTEARSVAERLLATTRDEVLLHGDLHHFNILQSEDGWVAIDPKGVIGDPCYEPCAFMRNPLGRELSPDLLRARLLRFHQELAYPLDRLWGWSFAQTYLCGLSGPGESSAEEWRGTTEALWELRSEFWKG